MMRKIVIIIFIVAVAVGSYCVFFGNTEEPINRDNLNQHGKLAIGVFLGRTVENSKTKTVVYEYLADTVLIQNSDGQCYLDSEKASDHFYFTKYPLLKGNEFVVLYDSLHPEISIIRLDYPLRDSTDFNSYVLEFQKKRMEKEELY